MSYVSSTARPDPSLLGAVGPTDSYDVETGVDRPRYASRRLLLRHAVQRAQAPDQLRAVNAHHFPAGEVLAQYGQRRAIVGVVEGRCQHQPVGDVEVGVAGG